MHPLLLDIPEHFETERLLLRRYRAGDGAWYAAMRALRSSGVTWRMPAEADTRGSFAGRGRRLGCWVSGWRR